jgi:hypothetical protein
MKRPVESDYTSHVAYTRALEEYCDWLVQPAPVQELYNELLFAVARVHPNETRHQTALRYIQQAESGGANQCTDAHDIKENT